MDKAASRIRLLNAMQREYYWRAIVVLLQKKGVLLRFRFLLTLPHHSYNILVINELSSARSKLENFELKIFLCVQLAVLSARNANIVHQNSNTMVWRGRIFTL